MNNSKKNFKLIQTHLLKSGFIFQNAQIYGGVANSYDLGHLGILLAQNIKSLWWKEFITSEINNFGLDGNILSSFSMLKASGHVKNFIDLLIENKVNKKRYRVDLLIKSFDSKKDVAAMSNKEMEAFIKENILEYEGSKCEWSKIKKFNLMFETWQGVVENNKSKLFLRPETAQNIFVNFKNFLRIFNPKLPFGIGQIGKAFRNEVTPKNFIFRTREFEQMELEIFSNPEDTGIVFAYYLNKINKFLKKLGLKSKSLRKKEHAKNQLAHYAKKTTDIEFLFPFGWGEIIGISNRGDFDLKSHSINSHEDLSYLDLTTNRKFFPHVIEPSFGVERILLAILVDAYSLDLVNDKERLVMKIKPYLAPYKFAILPLVKKVHQKEAWKLFKYFKRQGFSVTYDETGSIGKRYRRQDAIGTPYCLTVIDQTKDKQLVTIRYRDTMKQETISIKKALRTLKLLNI